MSAQNFTRKNLSCGPFSNNSFKPPFFSGNLSAICLISTAWRRRRRRRRRKRRRRRRRRKRRRRKRRRRKEEEEKSKVYTLSSIWQGIAG